MFYSILKVRDSFFRLIGVEIADSTVIGGKIGKAIPFNGGSEVRNGCFIVLLVHGNTAQIEIRFREIGGSVKRL